MAERREGRDGDERAYSDEAGHAFQYEAGHLFRPKASRGSDLMSANGVVLAQIDLDGVSRRGRGQARSGLEDGERRLGAAVAVDNGVSPDAWKQALDVLGEHDASIVIAAILQRGEEIKSAGGYLRVLTGKAREGEFSLGPVLMALLRGKAAKAARERRQAG